MPTAPAAVQQPAQQQPVQQQAQPPAAQAYLDQTRGRAQSVAPKPSVSDLTQRTQALMAHQTAVPAATAVPTPSLQQRAQNLLAQVVQPNPPQPPLHTQIANRKQSQRAQWQKQQRTLALQAAAQQPTVPTQQPTVQQVTQQQVPTQQPTIPPAPRRVRFNVPQQMSTAAGEAFPNPNDDWGRGA